MRQVFIGAALVIAGIARSSRRNGSLAVSTNQVSSLAYADDRGLVAES
jgi:hypothetical protein